jgi:hypothetical protein
MSARLASSFLRPVQSAGVSATSSNLVIASSTYSHLSRPYTRLATIRNHVCSRPLVCTRVTSFSFPGSVLAAQQRSSSSHHITHASSSAMAGTGDGLADAAKLADQDDNLPLSEEATPWLERIEGSIARSRKVRGGNFVQIATVSPEGLPCCRTVVFRGWVPSPDGLKAMKMITDLRSEKVCWPRVPTRSSKTMNTVLVQKALPS